MDASLYLDDEELTAVIAAILECESNAQVPLTEPIEPKEVAPERARKKRKSRRLEIDTLRDLVLDLESRRDALLRKSITPLQHGDEQQLTSAWQSVARRQRAIREQAIAHNAQYRQQIAENSQVLTRLQRHIAQEARRLRCPIIGARRRLQWQSNPTTIGDVAGYLTLYARIPALYSQTDSLFQAFEDVLVPAQQRTAPIMRVCHADPTVPDVLLDAVESRLVPFTVEQTAHAVWQWLSQVTNIQDVDVAQNGVMQNAFIGHVNVDAITTQCHGKAVFHRFIEANRVVIVATALVHAQHVDVQPYPELVISHMNWIVLSQVERPSAPCTEIICRDMVIREDTSQAWTSQCELHTLRHLIASDLEERWIGMREIVDNNLFRCTSPLRLRSQ